MRVVLAWCLWTNEYKLFGHLAKRGSTWPPLNLALLGAVIEEAGHEAIIIDGEVMGHDSKELAEKIIEAKPDIVGLSAYSPFFHLSCDVAAEIKKREPDIPIMIGGPHVTITKEKALLPQFDYGFLGEAEDSLPEFLNALRDNKSLRSVRGIMWREDGEIINTGERWVKTEAMTKKELSGEHPLDRFPLPARHLLPMERYRLGTSLGRSHFTSLQTARGCPWR